RTKPGPRRPAHPRTQQRVESRRDAQERTCSGADAATGHSALAPGIAAGRSAEEDGGEGDVFGDRRHDSSPQVRARARNVCQVIRVGLCPKHHNFTGQIESLVSNLWRTPVRNFARGADLAMLKHIDHVTVAVTDVVAAIRFFGLLDFGLDKDVMISGPMM